jgi:hypothetical protein
MIENCTKSMNKPCCGNVVCMMSHTKKCCWHEDIRKDKNMMYIDGYGDVNVSYYGINVPIDIYYCPNCKTSKETIHDILDSLNKIMEPPELYHDRITRFEKEKSNKIKNKIKSIDLINNKKKEKENEKKMKEWRKEYALRYGFKYED